MSPRLTTMDAPRLPPKTAEFPPPVIQTSSRPRLYSQRPGSLFREGAGSWGLLGGQLGRLRLSRGGGWNDQAALSSSTPSQAPGSSMRACHGKHRAVDLLARSRDHYGRPDGGSEQHQESCELSRRGCSKMPTLRFRDQEIAKYLDASDGLH